jgi:MFS transporter, ACS family, DAL5 transporter family protein
MSEKQDMPSVEKTSAVASLNNVDVEVEGWDEKATKRLLWRLDWHIIPFMSLIYL